MYDIESHDFKIIESAKLLASNISEMLGDTLGKVTVPAFNHYPLMTNIITGSVYSITYDVKNMEDNTATTEVITYTSVAGDTVVEVLNGLVLDVVTNHPTLYAKAYTSYPNADDMYLTITPIEGYSTTFVSQVDTGSDPVMVSAETNTPCVFLAYGKQPTGNYPRITLTPMPIDYNKSPTFKRGSVEIPADSGDFFPFTDKVVDYRINVTCESGAYEEVLEGKVDAAEDILGTLLMKLNVERNVRKMMEDMDSGYEESNSITVAPVVSTTEYMSIASMIMNFNTVKRFIDMDGAIFTTIVYDAKLNVDDVTFYDLPNQTVTSDT